MTPEKLQSGLSPGEPTGIEVRTEAKILQDFIKENWNLPGIDVSTVDWGAHPSRTTKAITLNCYRIISNIYDKDVGSHAYYFDVPVAVDVYVRSAPNRGRKDTVEQPEPKIVQIDNYLREFINVNRCGLRSKGVNNIMLGRIEYPDEPADTQNIWYHLVSTVRMYFHMFRVPVS
jgi:hypothetical protein